MNMVEHCQTHPGGSVRTLSAPRKCQWGPQNCPKTAFFGPKWPYLAIGSPSKPKWVEHWLNMVEHCQTHPGGSVGPLGPPKSVTRGPQRRPKLSFLAQKGHFLAIDIVKYIRGGLFGPFGLPKSVTSGPERPQQLSFLAQK